MNSRACKAVGKKRLRIFDKSTVLKSVLSYIQCDILQAYNLSSALLHSAGPLGIHPNGPTDQSAPGNHPTQTKLMMISYIHSQTGLLARPGEHQKALVFVTVSNFSQR